MSERIAIYVPSQEIIPFADIQELTAIEPIMLLNDVDGTVCGYRAIWDDVQIDLRFPDQPIQTDHLQRFQALTNKYVQGRQDKKAKKVARRAERMVQMIDCEITPAWDADRKAQFLVQGVMAYYDYAIMVADRTLYNENGNIEIGREHSPLKYWAQQTEDVVRDVPNERKKRSLQVLNRENVPTIKHLRNLPDDDQITLRPVEQVAKRAIALNLISRRADGQSRQWYEQKVQQYQLHDVITEQEQIFNQDDSPPDYVTIMFSQRLEAYWLLIWALQFIPNLARPNSFANAERAHEVLDTRSLDQFLLDAKLRRKTTILDVLDLHFRYHWAVVDAELYGKKPPTRLEPDVIYQRHYALNWLTQFHPDQDWDAVTTDT